MFPGRQIASGVVIVSMLMALSARESSAEWYANLSGGGSLTVDAFTDQGGGLSETGQFFGLDARPQAPLGDVWPGMEPLRLRTQFMVSGMVSDSGLQPYLLFGPAFLSTRLTGGANCVQTTQAMNSTPLPLGLKLGSGVGYEVSKWLSLFTEYGFTHFTGDQSSQDNLFLQSLSPYNVSASQHHFTLGFTHKFE